MSIVHGIKYCNNTMRNSHEIGNLPRQNKEISDGVVASIGTYNKRLNLLSILSFLISLRNY